jgi:hypothetical protein
MVALSCAKGESQVRVGIGDNCIPGVPAPAGGGGGCGRRELELLEQREFEGR